MSAQYWLAFAAYLIPTFPLGYFWHLRTFKAQYDELALYRTNVIIPFGLLSMVIQGLLFAWSYPLLFSMAHDDWLKSAALCSATFGLLAWSFTVLPVAAKYKMSSIGKFLTLETGFTILQYVVTAPLMALAWRAAT